MGKAIATQTALTQPPQEVAKKPETEVAKVPPQSLAQRVKEESLSLISPFAQARAAATLSGKMQWGHSLTAQEASAYESIAQARGVSILDGTAYVLGGNLYCSLQGRLKLAHESGTFGGFSVDRPMTQEERGAYEIKEAETAWVCTVVKYSGPTPMTFSDYGRASKGEKNPVASANPVEMAMKRARARALKLAYPIGLQSAEEVDTVDVPDFREIREPIPMPVERLAPPVVAKSLPEVAQELFTAAAPAAVWTDEKLQKAEAILKPAANAAGWTGDKLVDELQLHGPDATANTLGADGEEFARRMAD